MFVSIYIPMFDMRGFGSDRNTRTQRPQWPVPNLVKPSFQRNLGAIIDRPLGGVRGWASESSICEIKRSLVLEPANWWPENKPIRAAFKRFYSDGEGGAQFSIGFAPRRDPSGIAADLDTLLGMRLRSRHRTSALATRDAGRLVADLFAGGTTRGNRTNNPPPLLATGVPIIQLQGLGRDAEDRLFDLSRPYATTAKCIIQNISARLWGESRLPVLLISGRDADRQAVRAVRIILARLHLELFCFEQSLQLLSGPAFGTLDEVGRQALISRIAVSVNRLSNASADLYGELNQAFATVHKPGRIDGLRESLRIIGVSLNLSQAIVAAVKRTGADFEGGEVPLQGASHVTNNYINHGQAGAFGENASATNFTQAWSGVADKIDLPALATELRALQAALQSEAVGGDQFDSVAAVAKASEAAEKGDGPGVVSHLAKAGKWALSVAEKIGVGLAVVAIKAHVAL